MIPQTPPPSIAAASPGREAIWTPLVRAIDACRLYDADHPAVLDRLAEAAAACETAGLPRPCTFLVEPTSLPMLGDAKAGAGAGADPLVMAGSTAASAEARLAAHLHALDAGSLRFASPPTTHDLGVLVAAVGGGRAGPEATDRFSAVARDTAGRLRVEPLDLAAVTLGEAGEPGPSAAFRWSGLRAVLAEGSAGGADAARVREAARGVAERLGDDPQLAAALLKERLAEAAGRLRDGDAEGLARLRAFAGEVADQLDRSGRGAAASADGCRQSMLLCRALSQFQPDEAAVAGRPTRSWDGAVDDLFRPGGAEEHTPAAYMRRLEALANRQDQRLAADVPPVGPVVVDPARFDAGAIERDAAGVLLLLAEDQRRDPRPAAEAGPCVLSHLATRLPAMVERCEFVSVARVVGLRAEEVGDDPGPAALRVAIDAALGDPALAPVSPRGSPRRSTRPRPTQIRRPRPRPRPTCSAWPVRPRWRRSSPPPPLARHRPRRCGASAGSACWTMPAAGRRAARGRRTR